MFKQYGIYRSFLILIGLMALIGCVDQKVQKSPTLPNVVIFYVDDLGYGDLSSYGAKGVSTPEIDALAKAGVKFMDAHAASATCTPSRYALLTGEHGFRQNAAILPGDAPALIRPGKQNLASMFQQHGYATGVVGKWHLGLGDGAVNWNTRIDLGPNDIGFDYSFLIPATGDRVPTVYLEDHKVVDLDSNDPITVSYRQQVGTRPTRLQRPDLARVVADKQHSGTIINGVSRIGTMAGGKAAEWVDEDFADVLTSKADSFISQHTQTPFFLFFSFHDIHVPRLPHPRFIGQSEMGPRGDAIAQMDWITGQVVDSLKRNGELDNTLIVFTSDNGPVLNDGYEDNAVEMLGTHKPAGPLNGGKYSAFEGGTRVPTIVHWPEHINPGVSHALMSQLDLYASLAALIGHSKRSKEAIDSQDHLPAWLGKSMEGREELLLESIGTLALREGQWKYIRPIDDPNRGGFIANKGIDSGLSLEPQLYNLQVDISESDNIATDNSERTNRMAQRLEQIVDTSY